MAQVFDWTLPSLVGSELGQVIGIPTPRGIRLTIYLEEFKDLTLPASSSSQYWATLGVIYYLPLIIDRQNLQFVQCDSLCKVHTILWHVISDQKTPAALDSSMPHKLCMYHL